MAGSVSEADDPAERSPVVDVFVTGRTLRGTLGEAFVRDVTDRFTRLHGSGPAPLTSISRTVELTAVAVTRAGPVRVLLSIDDPAFSRGRGSPTPRDIRPSPGRVTSFTIRRLTLGIDSLDGIPPLRAARTVLVEVESSVTVRFRVHVVGEPEPSGTD